jgi:hypothetical protein
MRSALITHSKTAKASRRNHRQHHRAARAGKSRHRQPNCRMIRQTTTYRGEMTKTKILYAQARPIDGEELIIGQMSSDYFILCMERAFDGNWPLVLDDKDLPVLHGMAACWAETALNPYKQIISAIKRLGSVKIWSTYEDTKHKDDARISTDTGSLS